MLKSLSRFRSVRAAKSPPIIGRKLDDVSRFHVIRSLRKMKRPMQGDNLILLVAPLLNFVPDFCSMQ